jgi:hypothetical protein
MDTLARMATGFLLMVNTVLMVLACNMLVGIRNEMKGLNDVATTSDVLAAAIPADHFEMPFRQKCTRCHTERRFAGMDGSPDEMLSIVRRMQGHPNADIGDDDVTKIQASLTILKCTVCHTSDRLRKLSLMNDEEQLSTIRSMHEKHGGPAITREEARQIQEAYKQLTSGM